MHLTSRTPVKEEDTSPGAYRDPSKEFGSGDSSKQMAPAEIAIIVVTVVALCVGLALIFWLRSRRQRRKARANEDNHELSTKRDSADEVQFVVPPVTDVEKGRLEVGVRPAP